jgi:hypothetical protein
MMTYRMFVDDVRDPYWVYPDQDTSDWQVCRTMQEAQHVIADLGWPEWISFDHDLGDGIPTGFDLAKWLVESDLNHEQMPDNFHYAVHSANGPGRENIEGLLSGYLRHRRA